MRHFLFVALMAFISAFLIHKYQQNSKQSNPPQQKTEVSSAKFFSVGELAPSISGQLLNNEKFQVSDQIGKKMIVLSFFATWCGPCRLEVPYLNEYWFQHKDEIYLLGIASEENIDAVRSTVKSLSMNYPVLVEDGALKKAFRILGYPASVVIGLDGNIQYIGLADVDPKNELSKFLLKNREIAKHGLLISSEAFEEKQRLLKRQTIVVQTPNTKPVQGFDPSVKDEIHSIRVISETPQSVNVEIEYTYSGQLGEKQIYIDCDPILPDGGAPFGMRPAPAVVGRNIASTILSSYSGTPDGAQSTKIDCTMNSRIASKNLAKKNMDFIKKWRK